MMLPRLTLSLSALALVVTGCEAGVTSLSSGVDGTKKISELSAPEQQQFCEAGREAAVKFFDDGKDGLCALQGSFAGALGGLGGGSPVALCEATRSACEGSDPMLEDDTCNLGSMDATTCEATVEEAEACFNASLTELDTVLDTLAARSCTELLDDDFEIDLTVMEPEACRSLQQKCPGLDFGTPGLSIDDD